MTTFTKEQLELIVADTGQPLYYQNLAAFALSLWKRAETAEEKIERLTKENGVLRSVAGVLFTKHLGSCHYCGVDDFARCPSGFPGCAVADDIICGDTEHLLRFKAERDEALRELAEWRKGQKEGRW